MSRAKLWVAACSLAVSGIAQGAPAERLPTSIQDAMRGDVPMLSAREIFLDYLANEIAADQKYNGRPMILGGTIAKVALAVDGEPYVLMKVPGSDEATVRLGFPKTAIQGLAALKAGESIMSVCIGKGKWLGSVHLSCQPEWAIIPVAGEPVASKAIPRAQVLGMLSEADRLDGECRGGMPANPRASEACRDRDLLVTQIRHAGWCWGHAGEAGYQRKWVECRPGD